MSAGVAYYDRRHVASIVTAVPVVVISAWTIVASLTGGGDEGDVEKWLAVAHP